MSHTPGLIAATLFLCLPVSASLAEPGAPPVEIIIKADDLRNEHGKVSPRWDAFVDFLKEKKIKAGIGIICNSLDGDFPDYFKWIKEQQATGLFEFWNHGYDHKSWKEGDKQVWEFKGTSYDQQKEHFTSAQRLAREKLGFPLRAFGAPFNATDAATVQVLKEEPDIAVWLYGDEQDNAGKLVLKRFPDVNIEAPIFVPSLDKFVEGFQHHPDQKIFVIQGHPPQWDAARLKEFEKIVDFLIDQHAVFVTPSEYYKEHAGR